MSDLDEKQFFTARETVDHEPPPCPSCGQPVDQAWLYVGVSWQPDQWAPGRWVCHTPGCQYGPVPSSPNDEEPAPSTGR